MKEVVGTTWPETAFICYYDLDCNIESAASTQKPPLVPQEECPSADEAPVGSHIDPSLPSVATPKVSEAPENTQAIREEGDGFDFE